MTLRNEITIELEDTKLRGELELPPHSPGLVIFAHGSGSSRHSPRNQAVARALHRENLGTLLFDLLTAEEEGSESDTGHLRFDISFLAERLAGVTERILERVRPRQTRVGYFGASTGAAAALVAAAELGDTVAAVVSRGGRPDLAADALPRVTAPTLLIVGGEDRPVIPLNEEAFRQLRCEKAMRLVPGASHLFEERGALEQVSQLAGEWFKTHLRGSRS